jgi:hypothetical protein
MKSTGNVGFWSFPRWVVIVNGSCLTCGAHIRLLAWAENEREPVVDAISSQRIKLIAIKAAAMRALT